MRAPGFWSNPPGAPGLVARRVTDVAERAAALVRTPQAIAAARAPEAAPLLALLSGRG